ncbi:unnamed protein product [Phaeothamnion confervicola]
MKFVAVFHSYRTSKLSSEKVHPRHVRGEFPTFPGGGATRANMKRRFHDAFLAEDIVILAVVYAISCWWCLRHAPAAGRAPTSKHYLRLDWERHVNLGYDCNWFKRFYRMSYSTFEDLVKLLEPALWRDANALSEHRAAPTIPVRMLVAMTLRFLGGASYLDVFTHFSVSQAAFYNALHRVVAAINECDDLKLPGLPCTPEACAKTAARFAKCSEHGVFQHCIGAVDGLIVKIKCPSRKYTLNAIRFFSGHKNTMGMNLQAVCDASLRLLTVSMSCPGSTNDARAWTKTRAIRQLASVPPPYHLNGDAAYPSSDQLLVPYPGAHLDPHRDAFNFYQSQVRIRIEQAFGLLVGRWGVLWKPMGCSLPTVIGAVGAVVRLHNFCINSRDCNIKHSEEDDDFSQRRPAVDRNGVLTDETFHTCSARGHTAAMSSKREETTIAIAQAGLVRPARNVARNAARI